MSAQKPAIIFLHSALGTSADLSDLMMLFSEQGYKTLTFSFRGHGESKLWPDQFRIDHFAQDLDSHIQAHNLKEVVVFGHSMGGYVALYHKAHFEDSPISMIFTYGTKFNWSQATVARELPMLDPEHLQSKFPSFADTLKKKHGEERWKQLLLSTAHMMQHLERLDGLSKEDLADVEIPVYLMLGDQDRMVTKEETELTKKWLKHGELKIIAHSKHELERTNLRELANFIKDQLI